jgi:hypothetical protein
MRTWKNPPPQCWQILLECYIERQSVGTAKWLKVAAAVVAAAAAAQAVVRLQTGRSDNHAAQPASTRSTRSS